MIYLAKTKSGLVGLYPEDVIEFLQNNPDYLFLLEKVESEDEHGCGGSQPMKWEVNHKWHV